MVKTTILTAVLACCATTAVAQMSTDTYLRFENLIRKVDRLEASVRGLETAIARLQNTLAKIERRLAAGNRPRDVPIGQRSLDQRIARLQKSLDDLHRILIRYPPPLTTRPQNRSIKSPPTSQPAVPTTAPARPSRPEKN